MISFANFEKRAKAGDALTVAFLGGSLTWGANASDPNRTSARALVGEKFRIRYPDAKWRFVDAAIGGTGSLLGIYRFERDVLAYKPDLVLLDFTVNDGLFSRDEFSLRSYEGLLRRIIREAACPLLIVMMPTKQSILCEDLAQAQLRTAHLELATRYKLPVADISLKMRELYAAGMLDPDKVWPPELFDTCHPYDGGYAVYADIIFEALLDAFIRDPLPCLPETWFGPDTFHHVCRKKISDLGGLPEHWRIGYPELRAGTFDFLCSRWLDNVAIAENCVRKGYDCFDYTGAVPGALHLRFRGETLLLFGESTVFSGKLTASVDGMPPKEINCATFGTLFAPSAYLVAPLFSGLDPEKEHVLTLTPVLENGKAQQIHLESICVAGSKAAEVWSA